MPYKRRYSNIRGPTPRYTQRFMQRRYRGLRRRLSRRRGVVLKRFFAPRQLVPPSATVRMVYNTPIFIVKTGSEPIGCGMMSFVANAIGVAPNSNVAALADFPIEGYALGSRIILATNVAANMYMYTEPTTPGILSNNYLHMGNMYNKYRVLNVKTRVSGLNLIGSSATTTPNYAGATIWNTFATDDKEVIDSMAERDNFCRPYIRMNRNTRTHTFMNQYSNPNSFVHKFSPIKLIRDRTAVTSGDYDGTCTRAATIGTDYPTYSAPAQSTYHSLNFQLYGFQNNNESVYSFPTLPLFVGYLTCTKIVKFFAPHANQDFYDAV